MSNLKRYEIIILLLIANIVAFSQDKVFYKDGKKVLCKIVAISENTLSYKDTIPNASIVTVSKNELLIAEYKTGEIYIFGNTASNLEVANSYGNETREQRKERKMKEWKEKEMLLPNGILGFYVAQIPAGRFTVSYERLLANKSIGILVPVSLTYDMLGVLNSSSSSSTSTSTTTSNNRPVQRGVGVIAGLDVNYYHDLKPQLKYFFGPRVRYGTAMTFGGIEYLSVQLQNGIMKSMGKKVVQSLSIGVGFFKLSKEFTTQPGYEPNQVYPSGSITWLLGFRL